MTAKKVDRRVRWICSACGEQFTSWASVERHDPTHRKVETLVQSAEPAKTAETP